MGDHVSAEGYVMLDNENFPLLLLHFCNLSFQKFAELTIIMLL